MKYLKTYESYVGDRPLSKTSQIKQVKSNETIRVYEDDNLLVVIPKTFNSMRLYGMGTKWCTTEEHSFNCYHEDDTIYLFIMKDGSNKKYIFSFEKGDFQDELGENHDFATFVDKYPKLKEILKSNIENNTYRNYRYPFIHLSMFNDFSYKDAMRERFDSNSKTIPNQTDVEPQEFCNRDKTKCYLQGGVMYVEPEKIWRFRHIRNLNDKYDNLHKDSMRIVNKLKEDIKANGFKDGVWLEFDREGYAYLGEGNHRLVASMELKKEGYDIKIPVRTHYQDWGSVTNKTETPERLFDKEVIDIADEVSRERHYHFNYLAPQSSLLNEK